MGWNQRGGVSIKADAWSLLVSCVTTAKTQSASSTKSVSIIIPLYYLFKDSQHFQDGCSLQSRRIQPPSPFGPPRRARRRLRRRHSWHRRDGIEGFRQAHYEAHHLFHRSLPGGCRSIATRAQDIKLRGSVPLHQDGSQLVEEGGRGVSRYQK
jgi:hypothetical protein